MTSFKKRPYPAPEIPPEGPDLQAISEAFKTLETEVGRQQLAALSMGELEQIEYLKAVLMKVRAMMKGNIVNQRERQQLGLFG